MAGESPGKPEQKQSSGETAGSERDPRLAVFREPKAADEGTDKAKKADKTDKAGKAGKADGAEKSAAEPESEPEPAAASGGEGRDERLREAVAAWVATTDDEDASDKDASGADASDEDASGGDASGGGAGTEARAKAEADETPVTKAPKDDAEKKSGDAPKEAPAEALAEAPKGAAEGASKAAEGADKGESEAEPKDASKGAPKEASKGTQAAAKSPSGAAAEDEPKPAGDKPKAVDQPTAIFKVPSAEEPADDATRAFSIAKQKGSDAETDAKAAPKSDAKSDPKAESKTDPKTDAPKTDAAKAEKPGGKSAGKPAADQPTTAIKAVRPAGAAESEGERTSQFVALKSTDPQPIKPPRPVTGDKPGKAGKSAAKDAAKAGGKPATETGAKSGTKADAKAGAKPAAEADVAPGTKWGAKAAAQTEAKAAEPEAPAAAASTGATAQPGALPDSERTKQQPLPPLDLLAQLTNTPPPPETPMRTVARRFKIWTPLVLLLLVVFVVVQQVRPLPGPTLALNGKTSFTFEGGSFQMPWPKEGQAAAKVVGAGSLGTYGDEKPVPTASVAKIMTAYVILKNHPLKVKEEGPKITIDAKAVQEGNAPGESTIPGLKEGQQYSEAKMLQMLMIHSANNVARALARWDAGSEQEFAKKMNAAAQDLGMKNTTYTDPSGLTKTTVSTAVDQLKLAEEVMKLDAFRPIVAMPDAKDGLPTRIFNSNGLIARNPELSVKGIKTGSSTAAGGALVWASYKGVDGKDQLILGATMAQHAKGLDPNGTSSLALVQDRTKPMIEAIRNALTSATTVKKGQVVGYVDDGVGGQTPVVATKDLKAIGVPGQKIDFKIGAAAGQSVPHEAKAGTVVGELTVGTGSSAAKVPVALQKDLAEPTFGAKLTRVG
ncbi:serine hydrolase [Streptomyces sp. NPDC007100]|uniref:D-alanyl-D-alanine carboxypeptidase family protein n=1 Tax=Streptomyces sp. NPDC007100 TaxID=3155602 RepID=UPI0033CFF1FA